MMQFVLSSKMLSTYYNTIQKWEDVRCYVGTPTKARDYVPNFLCLIYYYKTSTTTTCPIIET